MAEFWSSYGLPFALIVAQSLALLVTLLIIVAFLLYADRKVWAAVQMRRGPNVVGPWGLLESFADLLKFVFKEPVIPAGAKKAFFSWRLSSRRGSRFRLGPSFPWLKAGRSQTLMSVSCSSSPYRA